MIWVWGVEGLGFFEFVIWVGGEVLELCSFLGLSAILEVWSLFVVGWPVQIGYLLEFKFDRFSWLWLFLGLVRVCRGSRSLFSGDWLGFFLLFVLSYILDPLDPFIICFVGKLGFEFIGILVVETVLGDFQFLF